MHLQALKHCTRETDRLNNYRSAELCKIEAAQQRFDICWDLAYWFALKDPISQTEQEKINKK
jgi:hypothetical protein